MIEDLRRSASIQMNGDEASAIAEASFPSQQLCALAFGMRPGTEVLSDDRELGCCRPRLCAAHGQFPSPCDRSQGALRCRLPLTWCHAVPLSLASDGPAGWTRVSAFPT